ncbi:hypothetical protein A2696_00755 [Candidatus Curtissbacteria bacterium RIFCSPHIGHO2_01_FULL_41_13]|nr:MAG: hypothetical protein A2696_00755 [Candidatus Curtissbacteria bacterium RIFCSPHIGHO2_01_FULL_41_13]
MVTTYVFYKLPFVKTLLYYCITARSRKIIKDYFIYFPPGYKRSEIDKVVDISDIWEKKVAAMACHKSQIKDARRIIERLESFPKEEYFLTVTKK